MALALALALEESWLWWFLANMKKVEDRERPYRERWAKM